MQFSDGRVAARWYSLTHEKGNTSTWDSIDDLIDTCGHDKLLTVVWIDE